MAFPALPGRPRCLSAARTAQPARPCCTASGETTGRQVLDLVDGDWQRSGARAAWVLDGDGRLVVASGHVPLDDPPLGLGELAVGEDAEQLASLVTVHGGHHPFRPSRSAP